MRRVVIFLEDGKREYGDYIGIPAGHHFPRVELDDGGFQVLVPGVQWRFLREDEQ